MIHPEEKVIQEYEPEQLPSHIDGVPLYYEPFMELWHPTTQVHPGVPCGRCGVPYSPWAWARVLYPQRMPHAPPIRPQLVLAYRPACHCWELGTKVHIGAVKLREAVG